MSEKITIVVARYNEDLSWLSQIPKSIKITIYNKGLENNNGIKGNMIFVFAISYPQKQMLNQEQINLLSESFNKSNIL